MIISKTCTGCRACEHICARNAISLKENAESFLYAEINTDKCINCGLCHKICPQENPSSVDQLKTHHAWAAILNDKEILKGSSSGAFFAALAINLLKDGGVVFGVELNVENHAVYRRIDKIDDLHKIRSSKYLASDTNNTYKEVKELLNDGIKVLYSGLPCHIAGLRAYLRKDYDNLLLVDVICHGTPSIKLFDIYLEGMKQKLGSELRDYKFRDKSKHGWGCYWSFVYGKKSQKNGGQHDDPYVTAFIDGYAKRDSCYACRYAGLDNRPGDITLGDYWGIDQVHPEMASNAGVSAVIAHTSKGEAACKEALCQCRWVESDANQIGKYNPSLMRAEQRPSRRQHLYDGIYEKNPRQFVEENLHLAMKGILKTKVRLLIPYWMRVLIKKIK